MLFSYFFPVFRSCFALPQMCLNGYSVNIRLNIVWTDFFLAPHVETWKLRVLHISCLLSVGHGVCWVWWGFRKEPNTQHVQLKPCLCGGLFLSPSAGVSTSEGMLYHKISSNLLLTYLIISWYH